MALKTTTELLEETEAAISRALWAQRYTAGGGRSKDAPNLDSLYTMRAKLLKQLALESGTGGPSLNRGIRARR